MSKEREALKLALEALEWFTAAEQGEEPPIDKAITVIKEALAQPEFVLNGIDCSCGRKWRIVNNTLTASAQPEQKPVATLDDLEQEIYENTRGFVSLDVMEWMLKRYYTTPPQRPWVGLTDEEVDDLFEANGNETTSFFWVAFARAIEAKLKGKNT